MTYSFKTNKGIDLILKNKIIAKYSYIEIKNTKEYIKVTITKKIITKSIYKKLNELGINLMNNKIDLQTYLIYKKRLTDNKPKIIKIFKNKNTNLQIQGELL